MTVTRGIVNAVAGVALLGVFNTIVMADNFSQYDKYASFSVGVGSAFNDNYTVAGVGLGFFPINNLEVGLDARLWLGGDVDLYEITPSLTYIVTQRGKLQPYVGVLYRKTFIESYDDLSAYGARAGVIFESNNRFYSRAGLVYVEYQNCNETIFRNCSETYPELTVGMSF